MARFSDSKYRQLGATANGSERLMFAVGLLGQAASGVSDGDSFACGEQVREQQDPSEILQPGALVDGGARQLAVDAGQPEGVRFFRHELGWIGWSVFSAWKK